MNKIPHWSRLGRLKRSVMPKMAQRGGWGEKAAVSGRLLCDVKLSAKELIRAKTYDLPALAEQVRFFFSSDSSFFFSARNFFFRYIYIFFFGVDFHIRPKTYNLPALTEQVHFFSA